MLYRCYHCVWKPRSALFLCHWMLSLGGASPAKGISKLGRICSKTPFANSGLRISLGSTMLLISSVVEPRDILNPDTTYVCMRRKCNKKRSKVFCLSSQHVPITISVLVCIMMITHLTVYIRVAIPCMLICMSTKHLV